MCLFVLVFLQFTNEFIKMIIKPLTHIIMNMHHMCASLYIVEDSRELARLLRGSAVSLDGKMGVGSLHFPFLSLAIFLNPIHSTANSAIIQRNTKQRNKTSKCVKWVILKKNKEQMFHFSGGQ